MTAMEAICDPISLYDPIYNDGGDVIMVMDQISDKEDKEEIVPRLAKLTELLKDRKE